MAVGCVEGSNVASAGIGGILRVVVGGWGGGDDEEWKSVRVAHLRLRRSSLRNVFANGGGGRGFDLWLHASIGIHFHLVRLRIDSPCRFGCIGRLCCQLHPGSRDGSIEGSRDGSRDGSSDGSIRHGGSSSSSSGGKGDSIGESSIEWGEWMALQPDTRRHLRGAKHVASMEDAYDTGISCNGALPPDGQPQCPADSRCMYFDENPSHDLMSFDSVGFAVIILMQAITFDDFATSMYALMRAFSPGVWVYYVGIVTIGGFFVINLFLAVIFSEFIAAQNAGDSAGDDPVALAAQAEMAAAEAKASGGGNEADALLESGLLSDGETKPQKSCCDCPSDPESGCRRHIAAFATGDLLGNFSTFLVLVNMTIMCMAYEGMPLECVAQALLSPRLSSPLLTSHVTHLSPLSPYTSLSPHTSLSSLTSLPPLTSPTSHLTPRSHPLRAHLTSSTSLHPTS